MNCRIVIHAMKRTFLIPTAVLLAPLAAPNAADQPPQRGADVPFSHP
jgi:hypothetical protein